MSQVPKNFSYTELFFDIPIFLNNIVTFAANFQSPTKCINAKFL